LCYDRKCVAPSAKERLMTAPKNAEQKSIAESKKAGRERDALIAMREYQAESARIDANTARLRALRIAKEAAEAKNPPPPAPAAKPAAKKKAAGTAKTARPAARSKTRA
jgi:hypothetical protein